MLSYEGGKGLCRRYSDLRMHISLNDEVVYLHLAGVLTVIDMMGMKNC
jgi:hypothetical protein